MLAGSEVPQEIETSFHRASAAAEFPAQKDTETNMNASQNMKSGSSIERQLGSIRMSEHQRDAALHQARIAELFVGAIVWVGGKFARPDAGVFAKPSPKY
jgi:hypothetical protein